MADLTPNGVCYALHESPYFVWWRGYTFFFSSDSHARKFRNEVAMKCAWLDDSFRRRFKYDIQVPLLATFQFYRQVETRGFFVVSDDGEVFRCRDEVRFGGLQPSKQDLGERSNHTTPPLLG